MIEDDSYQQRGPGSGALSIERGTAVLRRDAAIARVGRTRAAVVAGAAGLTGALYMLASALAPGHTLGATTHPTARYAAHLSSNGQAVMPALANPSTLGLQGAGNAPVSPASSSASGASNPAVAAAAAPAPAVVSGGS